MLSKARQPGAVPGVQAVALAALLVIQNKSFWGLFDNLGPFAPHDGGDVLPDGLVGRLERVSG